MNTTTQAQQQEASALEQEQPTVRFNTVTGWRSEDHATYLGPHAVGTTQTAIQGVRSILAILMQHRVDMDSDDDKRFTLDPNIVDGLLCAAESCATLAERVMDGKDHDAHAFGHGTPQEKYMTRHACDIASGRKVVVSTGNEGKAGAA